MMFLVLVTGGTLRCAGWVGVWDYSGWPDNADNGK